MTMMDLRERRNDETQYLYYLIISQLYNDGYTQQANQLEMLTLRSCEKVRAGNNLRTMLSACISSVFDVTSYFIENQPVSETNVEIPIRSPSKRGSPKKSIYNDTNMLNGSTSTSSTEESVARTLQSIEQHLLETNKILNQSEPNNPSTSSDNNNIDNNTLSSVSPDIEHLLGQLDSYMKEDPVIKTEVQEFEDYCNNPDESAQSDEAIQNSTFSSNHALSSDIDLILQGVQIGLENNLPEGSVPKCENDLSEYSNYVKDVFAVDRQLKCSICDYLTYSKRALTIHLRSHAGHGIRCKTHSRKDQERMVWNKKHRPYPCVQCNYRASSRIQLTLHIRTHTGEKPNLCPYCDYRTAQKGNLNTHIKQRHGEIEPFTCEKCHFKTSSKIQLSLHIAHVHKDEIPEHSEADKEDDTNPTKIETNEKNGSPDTSPIPIIANRKFHQCLYCDYSTAWKGNLKAHVLNRHGGAIDLQKIYYCKRCNFQASSSQLMNKHFRTHSAIDRPHQCMQCDYRAGLKSTLETHVKYKHTKERPFSCSVCDYRCVTKGQLQVHERRHTGERPFSCPYCEFRTAQQSNLRSHVLHRHPEHQFDVAWKGTRGRPRKEFKGEFSNADINDMEEEDGFDDLDVVDIPLEEDDGELPTQLVQKRKIS